METVPVYLEVGSDGTCMAHVLNLPGCFVRAPDGDAALGLLPAAIGAYEAWLRRHGEPVVLTVKAHKMYEAGHEFFKTESAIWLTKDVPLEYIVIEGSAPALSD